ncbi:MAG: GatB/YqeY domain-containing protein [Actinomycetales bacterium]
MSELKERLQSDLTGAIRSRNELTAATIRMALTAITNAEVAGTEARELTNDDVVAVLGKEAKKRREAAEAYDAAGRPELAERERAELGVLETYLPAQLSDEEIAAIVDEAIAAAPGLPSGMAAMGPLMKAVNQRIAGRADGGRVAAVVKGRLSGR